MVALAALVALAAAPSASAAVFVGVGLADLQPQQKVLVPHPAPVQLIFRFEARGVPDARATQAAKAAVLDAAQKSGLFAEITEGPAPGGAIVNVAIDDEGDIGSAEAKGVATGLTLGLAGNYVADTYTTEIEYFPRGQTPKITRTVKQSMFTQVGLINRTPPNAVKVDGGPYEGVTTVIRQTVSHALNEIASDPAFQNDVMAQAGDRPSAAASAQFPATALEVTPHGSRPRNAFGAKPARRCDVEALVGSLCPLPAPAVSLDALVAAREADLAPIKIGIFDAAPGDAAALDKRIHIRGVTESAPSGSFAAYLGQLLAAQLTSIGRFDADSGLVLAGLVTDAHASAGPGRTTDKLKVRFVLTRNGVAVFEKEFTRENTWNSNFLAAVAIPEAINHYLALYPAIAIALFADSDFRAAAHRG
jgi:hypothetical protein